MPYYSNIPTANQKLKDSQPLLLANFTALNAFGNGYADFPVQGSTPTFGSGDTGLYTKQDNAITTKNEMYLHRQGTSGLLEVPFTASKMSDNTAAASVNGWSYLPSGLLIKWGVFQSTQAAGTLNIVDVGTISGGPSYTQVFQTYATPFWQGAATANFPVVTVTNQQDTLAGNFRCMFSSYTAGSTYTRYLVMGV